MHVFNIKDPKNWQHVMTGETIAFEASGQRNCRLTINTTAPVTVWVADNADMQDRKLLARAEGLFEVAWTGTGTTYVEFDSNMGAIIYVCGHVRTTIYPPSDSERFTSVMPQGRRNSDYDRMVHLMNLNERRRDKQLQQALAELKAGQRPPSLKDAVLLDESDGEEGEGEDEGEAPEEPKPTPAKRTKAQSTKTQKESEE